LREAARDKRKVQGLQTLYATWTRSLAELTPGPDEIDAGYKQRVTHPYGAFETQIQALREPTAVAAAKPATKPPTKPATKKKSASP
jgi:hypothetical protein